MSEQPARLPAAASELRAAIAASRQLRAELQATIAASQKRRETVAQERRDQTERRPFL